MGNQPLVPGLVTDFLRLDRLQTEFLAAKGRCDALGNNLAGTYAEVCAKQAGKLSDLWLQSALHPGGARLPEFAA